MQIFNRGETSSMSRENVSASEGNPTNSMIYSKKYRFNVRIFKTKALSYLQKAGRKQESISKYYSVSSYFISYTIVMMTFLKMILVL